MLRGIQHSEDIATLNRKGKRRADHSGGGGRRAGDRPQLVGIVRSSPSGLQMVCVTPSVVTPAQGTKDGWVSASGNPGTGQAGENRMAKTAQCGERDQHHCNTNEKHKPTQVGPPMRNFRDPSRV